MYGDYCNSCACVNVCKNKASYIRNCPDRIEVPKRGQWLDAYEGRFANKKYVCSLCSAKAPCDDWSWNLTNFCPNCGADMRGVNNG